MFYQFIAGRGEDIQRIHVIIEGEVWQEHRDLTMKVMRGHKAALMGHRFADTTYKPKSTKTPEKIIAHHNLISLLLHQAVPNGGLLFFHV